MITDEVMHAVSTGHAVAVKALLTDVRGVVREPLWGQHVTIHWYCMACPAQGTRSATR